MNIKTEPWSQWTPGVLTRDQVQALISHNYLDNASASAGALGAASLDLHISDRAFQLPRGSCKPSPKWSYAALLDELATPIEPGDDGYFLLQRGNVYVFFLNERVAPLKETPICGRATAKSSVGRLDILARLIADRGSGYERFALEEIGNGNLYLEVTSNTVPLRIRTGQSLNQLRLFYGEPQRLVLDDEAYCGSVNLQRPNLAVDLAPDRIGGLEANALRLYPPEGDLTPLCVDSLTPTKDRPDPCMYMRLLRAPEGRLTLEPGAFYLMRSKERIRLPKGLAVYCLPHHEAFGELRVHYAGFIHPWFGTRDDGEDGTPLIFEIRGHQSRVTLFHGETIGQLTFFRMSEDAPKDQSAYANQTLQASALLAPWPSSLEYVDEQQGIVRATDHGA